MPKLKDVAPEELRAIIDRAQNLQAEARDIERRLTSALAKSIESPMQAARALLSTSRTLADLASTLLMRAALREQERELEASLRASMTEVSTGDRADG